MSIDLLRHGDTGQHGYRGQLDDPLTALGWQQLQAATLGQQWDRVISSPLRRCAEFAQAVASAQGLPWQLEPRLAEYHFGDWQGVSIETLAEREPQRLQAFWADPLQHPPPAAESLADFAARVRAGISAIAQQAHGERVLVVTHGGVIRAWRCHEQALDLREMVNFEVPHACLHRVQWPGLG